MDDPSTLESGDPEQDPASYTRFVLPFAYEKSEWAPAPAPSKLRFLQLRPGPPAGISARAFSRTHFHRKYLTFETAEVLYERAKWLELCQGGYPLEQSFHLYRPLDDGEKPIAVTLAAPLLVLFEWPKQAADAEGRIFATGFLVLELWFPEPISFGDLCWVNEIFRYWMKPFKEHPKIRNYRQALRDAPIFSPDGPLLPPPQDADPYLDRWSTLLGLPCGIGNATYRLVSDDLLEKAGKWVDSGEDPSGWIVYSDHRAFVWTCAVARDGAAGGASAYWTRLLNVDPPHWGGPSSFETQWIEERTYRRWEHLGSIYGFTLHSGAALIPPEDDPPLWRHFRESYFDQTLLLLYTRVSLFRISRRLSEVSAAARDRPPGDADEQLRKDLTGIRKSLTLFANLYQFPLLSNQQQGIELYALAHRVMDIEQLSAELGQQVNGSHELLEILSDHEEALAARRLNVVAAGGLALAVATGFLGMNVVAEGLASGSWSLQGVKEWAVFVSTLLITFFLLLWACRRWTRIEDLLFPKSKEKP